MTIKSLTRLTAVTAMVGLVAAISFAEPAAARNRHHGGHHGGHGAGHAIVPLIGLFGALAIMSSHQQAPQPVAVQRTYYPADFWQARGYKQGYENGAYVTVMTDPQGARRVAHVHPAGHVIQYLGYVQ